MDQWFPGSREKFLAPDSPLEAAPSIPWSLRPPSDLLGDAARATRGSPMGVLIEDISVVVKRSAIDQLCRGGWAGFLAAVPNSTLCADNHLARVGFLSPRETEAFVPRAAHSGLMWPAASVTGRKL